MTMDIAERFRLLQLEGNEEELRLFLLSHSGEFEPPAEGGEPRSGGAPEVDVPGLPGFGCMPDPDWLDPREALRPRRGPCSGTMTRAEQEDAATD